MNSRQRNRSILNASIGLAVMLFASCGPDTTHPTGPSPLRAIESSGAQASGFGQLMAMATPNIARCLSERLPECFSERYGSLATRVGGAAASAPLNLSSAVAGTTVTLTWTAPPDVVISYVLEVGSSSGLSNLAALSTGNAATIFTAPNVPVGTYFVRVRAVDGTGVPGPSSNEVAVVVTGGGCVPPSVPTGFIVALNSGGNVGLQWNAPAGGPAFYVLEAGSGPGASNLANANIGATTTFVTTGVGVGTYYLRIRAGNGCGLSGASLEITLVVGNVPPTPIPPAPTPPAPPPGNCRGTMSAFFDGAPFIPQSITVCATYANGLLSVVGSSATATFRFNVHVTSATTVIPITPAGPDDAELRFTNGRAWESRAAGTASSTVTVMALNAIGASGTFSMRLGPVPGSGANQVTLITGGVFNIPYR